MAQRVMCPTPWQLLPHSSLVACLSHLPRASALHSNLSQAEDRQCGVRAGVPVFLANMAVSSWIKFAQYRPGAIFMTAIMALGLLYMAFTFGQWFTHLVQSYKSKHQVSFIGSLVMSGILADCLKESATHFLRSLC